MSTLVIAPHPDDEILGVGGTIAKLTMLGEAVHVCIVTRGYPPLFNEDLIRQGRKEDLKAAELLRTTSVQFLDFPAARLDTVDQVKLNNALSEVINDLKPFVVYIPHRGDIHCDHIIDEGYSEYDIERNRFSTMHKIAKKEFKLEDFSHEHLTILPLKALRNTIETLNSCRNGYLAMKNRPTRELKKRNEDLKEIWRQMIQLLPGSYNQKRTVMLSYEVLADMYESCKNSELDEWHMFCDWIRSLPCSELITGDKK